MGRLLKNGIKWKWTPEIDDNFEQLKKEITEALSLAHFDPKRDTYVTTDACNAGLGQLYGKKRVRFLDQ